MGYRIAKTNYGIGWKLKFESYVGGQRRSNDIPKEQWTGLGLYVQMPVQDAKDQVKHLNTLYETKRYEASRIKIQSRLKIQDAKIKSELPQGLVDEFERTVSELGVYKWKSHWRAATNLIVSINLPPSEWCSQGHLFYKYFESKSWSPSYVQKLLYIVNKWGVFYSKRLSSFYEPIPAPKGRQKQRIADCYFDDKGDRASKTITPAQLESVQESMEIRHYNWLYLSIWVGLRPIEVDSLLNPPSNRTWELKVINNRQVLCVYQAKLSNIPRDKRYKYIPLITNEQESVVSLIQSKVFRRPLAKTMRLHFGEGVTPYAGRKGFVSLMINRGYTLEKISRWMGHQSIDRTWKSYTNKLEDLI